MSGPAEVQDWLCRWFERKGPIPGNTPKEKLLTDFFEAGLIDSLAVVELVADIERTFSVRFEDRHYQERRFSTIGGLAELVAELSARKSDSVTS